MFAAAQQQTSAVAAVPADEPRFDIFEFQVDGNTVLDAEIIERVVYPFLGERRSFQDVEKAQLALQQAYRDRGFGTVTVDLPEQRADTGVIRLQVWEGRIVRTRVTGSRYYSQGYILARVPQALEQTVPHLPTLQAQLGSVNRTADRRVQPVLRPGQDPGTTELDLAVTDTLPLHGSVSLNNQASANTSSTRLAVSARYDNVFQRDHSLGLQLVATPERPSEVKVLAATYTMPEGAYGEDSTTLSFTVSDSTVPAGVSGTNVLGKGRVFGWRRSTMLSLTQTEFHLLTLGADYKDFDETIETTGAGGFSTPIRYLPLSAAYAGSLSDSTARWQWGTSLTLGVRGLLSSETEFRQKRYLGTGGFSVLKADLTREQPLPGWKGATVRARIEGQWSGQPLISNEQFIIGGAESVRGYLESAAAGDLGWRASVEARSPAFVPDKAAGLWQRGLAGAQAHVFIDGAHALVRSPLPGQLASFWLGGAGLGARLKPAQGFALSLDLAWALRERGDTKAGDLRLHAVGSFEF